jgi:hypothetical protein
MRKSIFCFPVAILFLAALFSFPSHAQEYRATITGVVTDASKAVISNATVSVHNLDTGEVLTVKTNSAGVYNVSYLHPGQKLEVSAEAPGFTKQTYPPVVLTISQTQTANFMLQIGSTTQEVKVNSQSYQVGLDTENADRGVVVDNKTITQLPLNGRNPLSLLDYVPGVTNEGGTGVESVPNNMYNISFYTVNGTPAQNTEYTIDGMPNNANPWYSNGPSTVPSVDAMQEFKVTTNPYDAQQGRTASGVVSMELKSGTNDLHGSVYEFAKRGFMDANSWQNNYFGYNRPAHTEDQYGFEVDGPVYLPHIYHGRNKTFFMFNFEHFKQVLPNFQTYDIPNAAWMQGDFSNFVDSSNNLMPVFDPTSTLNANGARSPYQNGGQVNQVNPSIYNPIAVKAVNMMLAAAPATPVRFPGELPWEQIWVNTIPSTTSSTNYVVKFDQVLGDKDHLSGSWIRSYNPSESWNSPQSAPEWFDGSTFTEYHMNAGVDWTHTWRANLLTDVHFSYQRYWRTDGPPAANLNYDPTQLGFSSALINQLPLKMGFPTINFNMAQQSFGSGNGYNNWLAMSRDFYYMPDDSYNLSPTVTWNKNKHNLRAGLDFRISHLNQTFQYDNTMAINTDGQATSQFWNRLATSDPTQPNLPASPIPYSTQYSGNAVLDFLIGQPTGTPSGGAGVAVQNQYFPYYTWRYYAPWVQDDWKITPKFTLNIGFRYDLNGPPTARHNWLNTGFDFNAVNPISSAAAGVPTVNGGITFPSNSGTNLPWARDYTKWQPRVGFAWQVRPDTVIRGGAGRIAMNPSDLPTATGFSYSPVYVDSPDSGRSFYPNNLGNPFPSGIPSIPGASLGLLTNVGRGVEFANPKYKIPSVINGSLGIEQVMPKDGKIEISYVMTRGYGLDNAQTNNGQINTNRALYESCDETKQTPSNPTPRAACQNLVSNPFYNVPGVSGSLATLQQVSALQMASPYPQFTSIEETQNNWGHSWYNSLQTVYQQRLGWEQINASWTWSKTMLSGGYWDYVYLTPVHEIAGTDRQNRITVTSVLNVPIGRGLKYFSNMNRPVDAVVGGWELAADAFWESGQPVTLDYQDFNVVGSIKSHQPKHSTSDIIDAGANPCYQLWTSPSAATSGQAATPGYYTTYSANGGSCTGSSVAFQQVAPNAPFTSQQYSDQIRGPGTEQIDVNLSKNFKFTERISMQLRMEEFNVLNHPTWYGQVDMNPQDTTYGVVNKILTYGQSNNPRQGQLGVKVLW